MEESLIRYNACPSCGSARIRFLLKAIDHSVSGKAFDIWECADCTLRFTQDAPDAASIGPYYRSDDYISHTNTGKGFINQVYHLVRSQTMAEKYRLILSATRLETGRLLDIGAGTGAFVQYMQSKGWQVTGMEPDTGARERASALRDVQLVPGELLFRLPEESFNVITLWHVLEHVHDLHGYMEQLKKLLKPSGRIFVAVPNHTAYDAGIYKADWAAYDVPRHLVHFSPEAMEILLEKHELQLQSVRPMWYDSVYISLLSEKYRTGHSNFVRGMIVGLVSNLRAFVNKDRCSSLIYVISK
jgi:2-polyprenyl-3-methyl-5-hydroxy-6-metoxy-1,4-benzoquinol methylase